ncbi:gluconokinase [Pendulispora albinea]|uniref:Gluconokinase n=1 Tax=Pendulispora albinea TaxID=2741071 RepID=A0ABZ2LSW7_9BACT
MIVIVAGVSGSGKTTVGQLLARHLGVAYAEADDFHPPENIAKMAAGTPLTDADRAPWLAAIGAFADARMARGESAVVTCSALKRSYRDGLRRGRPELRIVYLEGSREVIARRLTARKGHFFPERLLDSQFRDLEPPEPDEGVLTVPISGTAEEIVREIVAGLSVGGVGSGPPT